MAYSHEGQNQQYGTNVIYFDGMANQYFFSPDGIGRIWYDTLEEAKEDSGLEKVYILTDFYHEDGE